jgi:hypothetical protein
MAFTFEHLTTGVRLGGAERAAATARLGSRGELAALAPLLARHGYTLARYSPGDGATRYRIVRASEDYFESPDGPTALGASAALAMVRAFLAGFEAGRRSAREDRPAG